MRILLPSFPPNLRMGGVNQAGPGLKVKQPLATSVSPSAEPSLPLDVSGDWSWEGLGRADPGGCAGKEGKGRREERKEGKERREGKVLG